MKTHAHILTKHALNAGVVFTSIEFKSGTPLEAKKRAITAGAELANRLYHQAFVAGLIPR